MAKNHLQLWPLSTMPARETIITRKWWCWIGHVLHKGCQLHHQSCNPLDPRGKAEAWWTEDNRVKNYGSGNEEHERELGHHPEAGQWHTGVEELRCWTVRQLAWWVIMNECLCVYRARESVHQQQAFSSCCATARWLLHFKEAGQSWRLVLFFHAEYVTSWKDTSWQKSRFHSSVPSLWSCQSGRLTKTQHLAAYRKTEKLVQQTFRDEYWTNVHVLWNLHSGYILIQWHNVCCIEFCIIHVGMYDVKDACPVHWPEHVHYT